MVDFTSPLVIVGSDFGYLENDHPVCGQGKIHGIAIYIHQLVQPEPSLNFLGIAFRKNYKVIGHEHIKSIS
jgi:hypothetical protein